jgi:hypothetical protein
MEGRESHRVQDRAPPGEIERNAVDGDVIHRSFPEALRVDVGKLSETPSKFGRATRDARRRKISFESCDEQVGTAAYSTPPKVIPPSLTPSLRRARWYPT